jgi:hypothetical protein
MKPVEEEQKKPEIPKKVRKEYKAKLVRESFD